MKLNSIGKNYILNLGYQILAIIIPIITMPYVSRSLGVVAVGLQSYANSYISYFLLLAALGTTTYAQREIARVRESIIERSVVFWEIFILRVLFTIVSTAIYVLFCFLMIGDDNRTIFLVQIIYIVSCAADITWLFQGMEDFSTVIIRNVIVKIINVAFIFAFVKTPDDLVVYIVGLSIFPLIANISVWLLSRKYVEKCSLTMLKPMRHLKGSIALFIPTVASQIYMVCDKTMLGLMSVTTVENGYYEQAEKIVRMALTVYSAYGTVVVPRIALLFNKKKNDEIHSLLINSVKLMWLITSALFWGIISISYQFVPWYLGDEFFKVSSLLIIFSWLIIAVGLSNVVAVQFLVPIMKQNVFTVSVVVGAIVNLILNAILIPRLFSIGAAIASISAETVITAIQVFYCVYIMKFFTLQELFRDFPKYFGFGAMMGGIVLLISKHVPASMLWTVILVVLGGLIYGGLLIISKDQIIIMIKGLISNLSNKLEKK